MNPPAENDGDPNGQPAPASKPGAPHALPGLEVIVDRVVYEPHLDAPPERPYPFVYFLTIHNGSAETVQIFARKWVVTDLASGHRIVVEGEGVVGQRPRLETGETFSYHSYHPVAAHSRAEGAFFGRTETGQTVFVRIPPFDMQLPPGESRSL
jgi:ApaG protein